MKISAKQLRSLIREELAAQAPPDAPLGQYAWPKERGLDVTEDDTDEEKALKKALLRHIESEDMPLDPEYADLLKSLLNKGLYNKVIKAPNSDVVYRGLNLSYKELDSILQIDLVPQYGTFDKSFVYSPRFSGSSWTKDFDTADKFSRGMSTTFFKKQDYCVILVANVNENEGKLVDFEEIYKLDKNILSNDSEKEVYAIGDVKVNKIIWANKRLDKTLLTDLLKGDVEYDL